MINRDRFLVEGLAKYYELKIQASNAKADSYAEEAAKFVANNGGSIVAALEAINSGSAEGSAKAFIEFNNAKSEVSQMSKFYQGLTASGAENEEFIEVVLEDFRMRTAVKTTITENGVSREAVVSKGQSILENREKGQSKDYDATTFKEKINLAEQYLTEKKGEQIGLFSGKSEFTSLDKFKEADIDELAKNIAVVDYQRELRMKEIPAENIRAAQMSTVNALSENAGDLEKLSSRFFPFLEKRSPEVLTEIFGKESYVVSAITKGQEALENGEIKDLVKKGVVSTEHLTGRLQPEFERIYNSLFGMNNLRERNPDAVHPYGALSQVLVNEAMTQIQKSPDGKVSKDWIDKATSSVFPETFVMDAIEHAQENQKFLNEFLQVREVSPDKVITITDSATRLTQVKANYPKVEESTKLFLDAVSRVVDTAVKSDTPLSDTEKLVMSQIVAREMTVAVPEGSALEAINVQLTAALAQSTEQLRVEGKLPELGRLNDLALSSMVTLEKGANGKTHTVPNEVLLEQIYKAVNSAQDALPESRADEKFDIPLYRPGSEEPINVVPDTDNAYEEDRDGEQIKITPTKIERVTDFTGENKGVLAHTFGSHFFQAADKTAEEKLGETTGAKADDGKQESGVYGTYGIIVQKHIYNARVKDEEYKKKLIKEASAPEYDGYMYKFIRKTKFYQQKYNEYLQIYMGASGIASFCGGIRQSDVYNSVKKYPVPEKVEEVVETQDPPVQPEPSPYDELGTKISSSFKILEKMHKRLVQRTVQGDGKDANRGLYLRNDQAGINAISSQSAMVRNYNSKVANTVLSNIQKVIEENPDRDPAEVVAELKGAMRFEKGKEVPVIPKGITISNDGQTVSFFGISYTREVNQDTNESTVYAHYNPDGERVPQSTLITIIAHDQDEVRDTVVNYMNVNKDVIEGREKPGQAPIIPDDTAVLNAFVQKDPTTGEYGLATGSDTLDRGPSGYDRGALDKADTSDMRRIDKACDNVEIIEAAVIDDPTA